MEGLVYSGKQANEKVSARLVGIQLVCLYNLNFAAGSHALMSDHSAVTVLISKFPGVLRFNNNLYRRTGKLNTQRRELSKKIVLDKSCLHRVV